MKRSAVVIAAALFAAPAMAGVTASRSDVIAMCKARWADTPSMALSCVERQADALNNLMEWTREIDLADRQKRPGAVNDPYVRIFGECMDRWMPNRTDFDWHMTNACVRKESRAARALEELE
ncbi:hypothetical protein [Pyruvatibacter mobilis]|uniref:hypothetical protein n=1 Tax=Pyruvatibacter mobilis TaxID=1712261 RepID=UPI003BB0FD8F